MWQNFFQSEKKFLNPYINKLLENKDYVMYEKTEIDAKKGKWQEHFGNENPVYLEIGSGAGNFTVRNSEKYRDKNYIGVELRFKRLILSANKARKRDLKNILFLRRNGIDLLNFIGKNEIDGMYINFPDPWEKKVKNRIISKTLFDKLEIIMKKGAKLYFKTDHYEYYCSTFWL